MSRTPSYSLIMDNLDKYLAKPVGRVCGNTSLSIVKIFIKPRASTIFVHLVYSLDGPGPSTSVPGMYEEFFSSTLGIWQGEKKIDECYRLIMVHAVWS